MTVGALSVDVDIEAEDETVALVGPNGAGKTTLLRTIAGAYRPAQGLIRLGGRILVDTAGGVELRPEQRRVGYVPQGYGLFPHLSVLDNVAFGRAATTTRASARAAAAELLGGMGCGHLASRSLSGLSGGERQRVALARALLVEPEILLLDEPLAALDVAARREVRGHLAEHLRRHAGPAVLVTHDARDARALAASVVVLDSGKVIQRGTCAELTAAPANAFVAEFFGL